MEQLLTKKRAEEIFVALISNLKVRLNLILWYKSRIKIEKMKVCMKLLLFALLPFLPCIISQFMRFILFSHLTPFQFALI